MNMCVVEERAAEKFRPTHIQKDAVVYLHYIDISQVFFCSTTENKHPPPWRPFANTLLAHEY
jgi:hypothetical protein